MIRRPVAATLATFLFAGTLAGCAGDATDTTAGAPPVIRADGTIEAPADVAKPPADAEMTASGIASKVLRKGTGSTRPQASSLVLVHYTGWTTDGRMFDSSYVGNGPNFSGASPIDFPLNQVIPGWTEGLQLMVVGEKRRFWIPGALAYEGSGRPGAPQGMLVFDVELLDFQ